MPKNMSKWMDGISEMYLGKLKESKCPECGNVDRLTEKESKKIVHCQRCYYHYEYGEV